MLTVDVGNTSIGVGRWSDGEVRVQHCAEPEQAARLIDGPAVWISVAPSRAERWLAAVREPGLCRGLVGAPLPLARPSLAGTGADRLAAARAVVPGPAVVVDAGTALTVDLVDEGTFLGGFIAAGPGAVLAGLARSGEALPDLDPGEVPLIAGVDTRGALIAGAWGQALGAADRLVAAAREQLPGATVHVTGGWGAAWAASAGHLDAVDPDLVHRGLRLWARA